MNSSIIISSLKLHGRHGVSRQEKIVGAVFGFDLTLKYPFFEAANDDDLSKTINYADVVDVVKRVNDVPTDLIETVALNIHKELVRTFPDITGGKIRVTKFTPPIPYSEIDSAAVEIEW